MPFEIDVTETELYQLGQVENSPHPLTRLLERRFGVLPNTPRKCITGTKLPQLKQWIEQSTTAQKLSDVFTKQ